MGLKILHVMNIAQNAYVNATILNARGHDCDVAAYDLYHFASSAEWYSLGATDVDPAQFGPEYFPNFYSLGQAMPETPAWLAHGPMAVALSYLTLRRRGDPLAETARAALAYLRFKATHFRTTMPDAIAWPEDAFTRALEAFDLPAALAQRIRNGRIYDSVLAFLRLRLMRFNGRAGSLAASPPFRREDLDAAAQWDPALRDFLTSLRGSGLLAALAIEREGVEPDAARIAALGLTAQEAAPYLAHAAQWRALAAEYDVCLFYGSSSQLAYAAGLTEYCALEHGTIRTMPFEETAFGRLLKAGFLNAARVFITNSDYVTATRRLEFAPGQACFLPHPFDEANADALVAAHPHRADPQRAVFFCPARQDWLSGDPKMAKGNDRYFRAAALLLARGERRFALRCVDWGVDGDATRALIAELGLEAHVEWTPTMPRARLWREMVDAAAVIDQFLISAMGAISFEALALGRRMITYDDGVTNKGFFGEGPPMMSAQTDEEIARRMQEVIDDPYDARGYGARGVDWVRRLHSADRIVAIQMEAYRDLPRVVAARAAGD